MTTEAEINSSFAQLVRDNWTAFSGSTDEPTQAQIDAFLKSDAMAPVLAQRAGSPDTVADPALIESLKGAYAELQASPETASAANAENLAETPASTPDAETPEAETPEPASADTPPAEPVSEVPSSEAPEAAVATPANEAPSTNDTAPLVPPVSSAEWAEQIGLDGQPTPTPEAAAEAARAGADAPQQPEGAEYNAPFASMFDTDNGHTLTLLQNGFFREPGPIDAPRLRMLFAMRPGYMNDPHFNFGLQELADSKSIPLDSLKNSQEYEEEIVALFKARSTLFRHGPGEQINNPFTLINASDDGKFIKFRDASGSTYIDNGKSIAMNKPVNGYEPGQLINMSRAYIAGRQTPSADGEMQTIELKLFTGLSMADRTAGMAGKIIGSDKQTHKMIQDMQIISALHAADTAGVIPDIRLTGAFNISRKLTEIKSVHPKARAKMDAALGHERVQELIDQFNGRNFNRNLGASISGSDNDNAGNTMGGRSAFRRDAHAFDRIDPLDLDIPSQDFGALPVSPADVTTPPASAVRDLAERRSGDILKDVTGSQFDNDLYDAAADRQAFLMAANKQLKEDPINLTDDAIRSQTLHDGEEAVSAYPIDRQRLQEDALQLREHVNQGLGMKGEHAGVPGYLHCLEQVAQANNVDGADKISALREPVKLAQTAARAQHMLDDETAIEKYPAAVSAPHDSEAIRDASDTYNKIREAYADGTLPSEEFRKEAAAGIRKAISTAATQFRDAGYAEGAATLQRAFTKEDRANDILRARPEDRLGAAAPTTSRPASDAPVLRAARGAPTHRL